MTVVAMFVDSSRIMKQREQSDDVSICSVQLSDLQTILKDASPVHDSMIAAYRQRVSIEDCPHDSGDIVDGLFSGIGNVHTVR